MCTQGNNEIIKTLKKELEEVKLRLGELEEYTHGTEIAKVDSEEVEVRLTYKEIENILTVIRFGDLEYWHTIVVKLNKMLKEKENETN